MGLLPLSESDRLTGTSAAFRCRRQAESNPASLFAIIAHIAKPM
jgi:hypothetical protein